MARRRKEIVISDANAHLFMSPVVAGERKAMGLVPRNFGTHPVGCYAHAKPFDLPLIPESEWADRLAAQVAAKAQLSDVRNRGMDGKPIPSRDQNGKGYCLPPGSLIRMADGSQKRVEDVRLLDEVLTAEGNVRRVMQCHVRDHDGGMVTVKAWGHNHLQLTPNHSVLTQRGYVPAGQLTAEDWIEAPRFAPRSATVVQTAAHVAGARRRVANVDGMARWETDPGWRHNCNPVPDFVELNATSGRIFGLWLAEGCFDAGTVMWCFGAHETDTLAAELVGLLQSEWGLRPTVKPGPGPNVTLVEVHGKLWRQLFESLLGKGAGGKRVHGDLMSGPADFLASLFWGWMDGDGCRRGRRGKAYHCGATVSHALALNMYDVASFLGLAPSVNREAPQQNRHAKTRRPVWKVQVNPEPSTFRHDYRKRVAETRTWRKVRGVEHGPYAGKVYNLGVEGDNSYVAEGVGVHNCWAHSSTSAALLVRAVNGEPYADLSAYAVACIIKGYRDEGGWGAESLEWIAENGIPTSKTWPQQSMSRSNDNPAMRAEAKLHRFTDWRDLDPRNMKAQFVTCLLLNLPVVTDLNWWSHSVCTIDLVSINPFKTRFLNSWGDKWSDNGTGLLEGSKAIPDSALCALTMTVSSA